MTTRVNRRLYRELSEPFRNANDANESLKAFFDDLYALREKHRIRDLLFVCRIGYLDSEGEEGDATLVNHLGDSLHMEAMAAHAYGYLSAQRQEAMGKEIRRAAKSIKRQPNKD